MTNDESNSNDAMTNDRNGGGNASFDRSSIGHSNIDSSLSAAVALVLAEADADIAARRPVCRASGRCCRFEAYGHRLYVTVAELAHFAAVEIGKSKVSAIPARSVSLPQFFAAERQEGCPYQIDGLCTARDGRPLGCRIYFCDENAQSWQNDVYEKYHAKLRAIHERFNLPYRYVEWREGLRELMAKE